MIDLDKIRAIGNAWYLTVPLTADATLIIPRDARRIAGNAGGGAKFIDAHRVILLGMAYTYVAGAAGVGFDLNAREFNVGTPATPRAGITRKIWSVLSAAANTVVSLAVPEMYVPLTGAESSPTVFEGSPASPVTLDLAQSARLELDVTGTAPTSGQLFLYGVYVNHDFPCAFDYQGSPFTTT